ncbi:MULTISPECIES: hypothetical protein [unclassified Pseudomonas]|jgi:hypothetical protein|uniref:hypothetical protein n=1 Tax=unclassified Pseudomonas TaxID=196821 RepID=UPI0008B6CC37|nr:MULTISPECIES: hypothetical protein [unclassified Pseudomonas]SFB13651.1 hypothetical protein SAMN03159485_03037 [Pseudomonas sp. NFPP24]SFO86250.1 hypothetical protein SAMN03159315_00874 [Pseudomonas sp. NFPP28]SES82615.1 hypothetical protein SAMN03159512_00621 [Pseudomonas sp. NFR09]SFH77056.1 hypothetical protein SAMN03159342_00168 [Pseudomonas sp. NFPP04]SFI23475.1 hypothetical protein SAMN03159344_00167 [Pseudomonas sp. NFPP11]
MNSVNAFSTTQPSYYAATAQSATPSAAPQPEPTRAMATEEKNSGCMSGCTGPVAASVVNSLARLATSVIHLMNKQDGCNHRSSHEALTRL